MLVRRPFVYVPALLVLAIEALVLWPLPYHIGDWFQFWYVGHITAQGLSPTDPNSWRDAVYSYPPYVNDFVVNALAGRTELFQTPSLFGLYPPWYVLLFLPFGLLPLEIGISLLHVTLIAAGVLGVVWYVSRFELPPAVLALALALGVAIEPFALASRTGHFAGILFVGALFVLVALERTAVLPLIVGAFILSLKPHLSLVFAAIVVVMLVRRRAWRAIAATSAVLVAIVAAFYIRYPPPIGLATQAIVVQATIDDSATTWSLAEAMLPGHGVALGVVAVLVAAGFAWWAVRSAPAALRTTVLVALSLALSLAASPYVHTYDQMLLVPALLLPLVLASRLPGPRRLAIGAATIIGAQVYPWFAYFSDVHARQAPTGAVPFIAIALVTVSVASSRSAPARTA